MTIIKTRNFVISFTLLASWIFISPAYAANNVASIYDGDTLTLETGAKVRLLQIDTPELSPSECYGQEARQALIKLIGRSKITLEGDSASADQDRYGRYLRYIFVGKKNVNLKLVKIGAAAPYFYNGEMGKYSDQLLKAAKSAKNKKLGLWSKCPLTVLNPTRSLDTKN